MLYIAVLNVNPMHNSLISTKEPRRIFQHRRAAPLGVIGSLRSDSPFGQKPTRAGGRKLRACVRSRRPEREQKERETGSYQLASEEEK